MLINNLSDLNTRDQRELTILFGWRVGRRGGGRRLALLLELLLFALLLDDLEDFRLLLVGEAGEEEVLLLADKVQEAGLSGADAVAEQEVVGHGDGVLAEDPEAVPEGG